MALLRTKRWVGFTVTVIVAIVAFGLLSLWQWHRADDKRAQRLEITAASNAPAVPLSAVVPVAGAVSSSDEWRHVEVTGQYLPSSQALVRKRPLDARNGFWVMTALQQQDGPPVWVNRGWISVSGDALSTPDAPAPPSGIVTVSGYVRAFDDTTADANNGLPAGQIAGVAPAVLPAVPNAYAGYVQLKQSTPAESGLIPLPMEVVDESRNVSYAMQWLLFAAVAIAGWFYFLYREAKEDAAAPFDPASGSNQQNIR